MNGEVVEEIMGAQPESVLRQILDQYIEVEVNPRVLEAQELLQQGQQDQAWELMQKAHEEEPQNQQITKDLIRLSVMMGEYDKAESMIHELPMEVRDTPEINELKAQIQFAAIIRQSPEPDTLEEKINADPGDLESRHQLAAWRVLEGSYEDALEQLLEIMKKDRAWQDDAARKSMLAIFDMVPGKADLVAKYRRQMFNLLH